MLQSLKIKKSNDRLVISKEDGSCLIDEPYRKGPNPCSYAILSRSDGTWITYTSLEKSYFLHIDSYIKIPFDLRACDERSTSWDKIILNPQGDLLFVKTMDSLGAEFKFVDIRYMHNIKYLPVKYNVPYCKLEFYDMIVPDSSWIDNYTFKWVYVEEDGKELLALTPEQLQADINDPRHNFNLHGPSNCHKKCPVYWDFTYVISIILYKFDPERDIMDFEIIEKHKLTDKIKYTPHV